MRKLPCLILAAALAAIADAAAAVDEDKPHGRICFSLAESGPPEKEEPFRLSAAPGPGKTVKAYIDASDKCTVLLVALTKDGKLANGWRPQLVQVAEDFEETELPKAPVSWDWAAASAPFDFYVLFLSPGSKDVDELTKLVTAMQAPKADDRLVAMQTTKLREIIGRISNDKEKTNQAPMAEPEVGGVFRGAAFPWRQYAQSINFGDDNAGVLILSSDVAGKAAPAP
ncbi:MAG TPA: hypothetical protein VK993_03995 [Chthoniobacterales bacterium]|nr:hypothetical protein [Chthoniobacterales bacterium]